MPSASDRVFLWGPPGAGKSTVGRRLAALHARPFVDTDELIVERTGMPIAALFAERGEAAFRALETAALADAAHIERAVIALGGGAVLAPANRRLVAAAGTSVYLRASVSTLEARLARQRAVRPLLAGGRAVGDLLAQRRALYEMADIAVDVDGVTLDDVVRLVADRL